METNLTLKMRDALYIAVNTGGLYATRDGDWRYGNCAATRTVSSLEKRGLVERQWTGATVRTGRVKGNAFYKITDKGRTLAEALTIEAPEGWDE